jgi:hypothetical protein
MTICHECYWQQNNVCKLFFNGCFFNLKECPHFIFNEKTKLKNLIKEL